MRAAAAWLVTVGAMLAPALWSGEAAARVEPVGTWTCVVWGHPEFGDERLLVNFGRGGLARIARVELDAVPAWSGSTPWVAEGRELKFSDPQTGRQYTADLRRDNLGGTWRTITRTGGWWCSESDVVVVPERSDERAAALPPVLPLVTATPRYPVEAIRLAKQGRVVACFMVDAGGNIIRPEFIEISDEVFRAPTLAALERSRYQARAADSQLRPSCRSYTFSLERLAQHEIEIEID